MMDLAVNAENERITRLEFAAICGEFGIHPAIALETDAVVNALREGDRAKLREVLQREF